MRNIHAALQELKTNYVSGLPLKVEAIESQWHRFQQDNLVDSLKELYILAHSLTGSGATFGFSALTDTAKTIERLIKPYLDGDNAISPQDKMVIHTKINHFKVLLKRINESTNHIETISTVKGVSLKASDSFHSVLLADDDDDTRSLISTQLKSFGFSVIEARNGAEAIECYKAHKPHIILMDVIMPEINGYDAVKEIRNQSRLTYLPIIFLTANDDESEVVRCIESGGDDFVVKSLNNFPVIAKIMAFQRIGKLYNELQNYRSANEEELTLGKHVFDTVLKRNHTKLDNISVWNLPAGHLSGDVQLYDQSPNGELNIFIGDFTGHGLPAAVGTLMVSDIFYSMTQKGIPAVEILTEINNKLNTVLPMGRYCAACFVNINRSTEKVQVWNCGLPEVYAVSETGEIDQIFESKSLPLGILQIKGEHIEPVVYSKNASPLLVAQSDGIIEAVNGQDEMFGVERLLDTIRNSKNHSAVFDKIIGSVLEFLDETSALDDISLVTIDLSK